MSFITDFKEVKETAARHNYSYSNWEVFKIAARITAKRNQQGLVVLGTFLLFSDIVLTLALLIERV